MTTESTSISVLKRAPHWSWIPALGLAVPLLITLFGFGWQLSPGRPEAIITIIINIAGVAIGWALATFMSPDSQTEATNFSTAGKTISAFGSGYLLSKVDDLVGSIFKPELLLHATDHLAAFRLIAFFSITLLTFMAIYFVRIYGLTVGS